MVNEMFVSFQENDLYMENHSSLKWNYGVMDQY